MTTSVADETHVEAAPQEMVNLSLWQRVMRLGFVRELLIIFVFCLLTSLVTWPYVTRLRDAVAGPGDPYLVSWILWWDYHQTFTDPLHLFNSNTFYPYPYTLAFSEHCYGIALFLFPLFALGLKPLTVHSIAMFLGFVFSGYGAFRLTRTLTGSIGAAWVAGIMFGFVPYRFNTMAQLIYLISAWFPLLFEALFLFVQDRTWKRAIWLGAAFLFCGLFSITWLLFSLIPLAFIGATLLLRYELWRDRLFWWRSGIALSAAFVLLLPFTVPYLIVSKMYGFVRRIDEVKAHSASPIHWLVAEGRSKLWHGMGSNIPEAWKFQLFPGLLPLLFPLAEIFRKSPVTNQEPVNLDARRKKWINVLDVLIVIAFALSIVAMGYDSIEAGRKLFVLYLTSERVLGVMSLAIIVRLCIAYPDFLRRAHSNLIETLKSQRRSDGFWIGVVLVVIGFIYSIGWNFFFYRLLYYFMPGFRSIRAPMRGAMFAYLGLAVLSALGVQRLSKSISWKGRLVQPWVVFLVACVLLLVELNNAPLGFMRGEVYPDQVTLRLKETPMRGGIMYFPAGVEFNQRWMLRSADHAKPLILGTSGFMPPNNLEIERMTDKGPVPLALMDLLEKIPASYLVVVNKLIPDDRKQDYQHFVEATVRAGRLRFINRFDESNDLYAVVKTEPNAKAEAALPFDLSIRDWAATLNKEPPELLGQPLPWGQKLYRLHVATTGTMPRYKEYQHDMEEISRGIIVGSENLEQAFGSHFWEFMSEWTKRPAFASKFDHLDNAAFVQQLIRNAGLSLEPATEAALIDGLANGSDSRAVVLLKVVDDPQFIEKQKYRSLLTLHYFAYLQRNPDDPPDRDLTGYNFWLHDLEQNDSTRKLATAFKDSIEHTRLQTENQVQR